MNNLLFQELSQQYPLITTIEKILNDGIDINSKNENGNTPLTYILEKYPYGMDNDIFQIIKLLVDHGADIHLSNNKNQTPLILASMTGGVDLIKFFIDNGSNVNRCDQEGISPLIYAIWASHHNRVKFLIDAGANINHIANDTNITPIKCAIQRTNKSIIKLLIKSNCTIDIHDKTITQDKTIKIMILKHRIKQLEAENLELKFRPGGPGYIDTKNHFENINNLRTTESV